MPIELDLTTTREQAVLALVIREAGRLLEQGNGYLGRTAIQKTMYFLQVSGVPVRYRFDVHHYGPFCAGILNDLDWLMFTGAIEDRSADTSRYSNYRAGQGADEVVREFESELEPYRETIRSVVEALLPLDPERLELVSTLHYAYRELRAANGERPEKERVVSRFCQFKGEKFPRQDIEEAYDQMDRAGLFRE